ncbi:hypothetical protein ACTMTI_07455 [Nonomuraea sp. H19]|uniref:hypothetical protein n=1 Tax=Nonomuraea sp. H19 TaxID=3452206 RepID=UPI003F8CE2EC
MLLPSLSPMMNGLPWTTVKPLLDQLLERLADVPTPAGPTPCQLAAATTPLLPIVDVRQGPARQGDR